jgi:hypothetical protein
MKENFENAIALIKKQDVDGCITGSCMLGYSPEWQQDIDVFTYNKSSFTKLLFFMYYNPMFTILDKLELYKFNEYIDSDKSSLDSIGLITIKMKYNLCVDVNVVFRKNNHNVFDVISGFDLDIIASAYDIKTKKTISLRESEGLTGTWNRWNNSFYKTNFWNVKRLLRQFERIIKYTDRGYDLSSVTDKYIELVEEILRTENYYKTEKGSKFFNDTLEQFDLVLKILNVWKKDLKISPEELLIMKTLI